MKIFIDAGHGGSDPGAVYNGFNEKDFNLAYAKALELKLRPLGFEVKHSRSSDVFVHINNRAKMANAWNADIFISIHCNAFRDPKAQGLETLYWHTSTKGKKLASDIQSEIKVFTKNRGIKARDNLGVLKNTKMPAALIELGFISNLEDLELIRKKQHEFIDGIVRGILKYFGKNEDNYYERDNLAICKGKISDLYMAFIGGKNLAQVGAEYTINGPFFDTSTAPVTNPATIVAIAVNNGIPLGPNAHINHPSYWGTGPRINRATFITNGKNAYIKRINHIGEIHDKLHFAVGGVGLIPDYDPTLEQIPNDILRKTYHTAIGYRKNEAYLIVSLDECTMNDFRVRLIKLNLDGAIALDGGGSSQMFVDGKKGLYQTRKLPVAIGFKKEK